MDAWLYYILPVVLLIVLEIFDVPRYKGLATLEPAVAEEYRAIVRKKRRSHLRLFLFACAVMLIVHLIAEGTMSVPDWIVISVWLIWTGCDMSVANKRGE